MEYIFKPTADGKTPLVDHPSFGFLTFVPKVPWQKYILEMIRKMNDICDRPVDGYELKINHFVNEIFYYIFHNVNLSKELSLKESRDLERMKDVMIYLNKTIDQKHTLADIASYCHLSNSECCRLFQRNVHLSPVDYLNQLRIHMSLSEIIKHEKKITDIAKMYGFSGSSYFSEMFKKTLGITPEPFINLFFSNKLFLLTLIPFTEGDEFRLPKKAQCWC